MFKKLNAKGFSHHLLLFIIPVLVIASIGTYVFSKSRAYGSNVCWVNPTVQTVNGMTGNYYHVIVQNRTGSALQLANMKFQATGSSGATATLSYYDTAGKPTVNLLKWESGFNGSQLDSYATAKGYVRQPASPAGVGAANYKFASDGKTFSIGCQVIPAGTSYETKFTALVEEAKTLKAKESAPAPAPVLPTYACANLKMISNGKFTVSIKNTSNQVMDFSKFKFRTGTSGPTPALSVDTAARGPINPGATLNAAFSGDASIDAGWYAAYVYDATNTVRVVCDKETTSSPTGSNSSTSNTNVDVKPYITLPVAPSQDSMTYPAWKAWSDGVSANKALTGQSLVDKLKPLKEAYDAKVAFAATISCKAVFPASLTFGTLASPKQNQVSLTVTNKGKYATPANAFTSNVIQKMSTDKEGKTVSTVNVPSIGVNATVTSSSSVAFIQTNGSKVTLSFKLLNADKKVVANCENGYKTYDLATGKETVTPDADKPKQVVVTGATPSPTTGASTNNSDTSVKSVASLGYRPEMVCVKKTGSTYVPGYCNEESTGIVLIVNGTSKSTVPKNKLTYEIEPANSVLSKKYKFKTATTCAPRSLVTGDKLGQGSDTTTYDCTVYYSKKDSGLLGGLRQSLLNRFKRIFNAASADTKLSNSEASAAMDQVYKQAQFKEGFNITMKYKNYKPLTVKNYKLQFDYAVDAADYADRINRINCQSDDPFVCGIIIPL